MTKSSKATETTKAADKGWLTHALQEERRALGRLVELLLDKEEVLGEEVLERRPRPLKSWSGSR